MKGKFYFNEYILEVEFDKTLELKDTEILEDIFESFSEAIILNRESKSFFNDSQQNNKYVSITHDTNTYTDLELLLRIVNNFMNETKQQHIVASITKRLEFDVIIDGFELNNTDINECIFSPIARMHWKNPQIIQNILKY